MFHSSPLYPRKKKAGGRRYILQTRSLIDVWTRNKKHPPTSLQVTTPSILVWVPQGQETKEISLGWLHTEIQTWQVSNTFELYPKLIKKKTGLEYKCKSKLFTWIQLCRVCVLWYCAFFTSVCIRALTYRIAGWQASCTCSTIAAIIGFTCTTTHGAIPCR